MLLVRTSIGLAFVLVVLGVQTCSAAQINRASFPKAFVFGTASSAYQYEGAVKEDGRGPTVWDKFAHSFGKVLDFSNADVAVDQYHRFDEDIQLMKDMGMDAYRFSIAWSRIFPNGTGEINQAGVDHYNNLINALLAQAEATRSAWASIRCHLVRTGDELHGRPDSNTKSSRFSVGLVYRTPDLGKLPEHNDRQSWRQVAKIYKSRVCSCQGFLAFSLSLKFREDGCNVKGYFVWSLLDNWEWAAGFTSRFGLYFVDYNDKLKRYPKDSVQWFKTFLAS
ncbi:hypothetical protein C3L33_14126, partial [Rhododendron williamsianum]